MDPSRDLLDLIARSQPERESALEGFGAPGRVYETVSRLGRGEALPPLKLYLKK